MGFFRPAYSSSDAGGEPSRGHGVGSSGDCSAKDVQATGDEISGRGGFRANSGGGSRPVLKRGGECALPGSEGLWWSCGASSLLGR